ncbi:hypothetical protein SRB5_34280 [Streptomyces sp. RB5]|uniref:Gram-positive cocci surface proteins LPxTG domain-containing protein n=1 Tax=Streptomyces smaragdinus TaxID=2585196 RepID=A0A7K0CKH9_9ACTN|nr:hypothetical protein [Streptomyces smaragdinus]MQY13284.1 hypothetical protein [Streptomyces smaragdinus]
MTLLSRGAALRRLVCALGAVGLLAVGVAAPVGAQEARAVLGSDPGDVALYPYPDEGAPRAGYLDIVIDNPGEAVPEAAVEVTMDFGGLAGVADWAYGADGPLGDCATQGAVVTCGYTGLWRDTHFAGRFELTAARGVAERTSGVVRVTGEVDGKALAPYTTTVTVGGADLVAQPLPSPGPDLRPGSGYVAPMVFSNVGTQPTDGVLLTMRATRGVEFVDRYDNCAYGTTPAQGVGALTVVVCEFEDDVAPGEVWEADPGERLRMAPHAMDDSFSFEVSSNSPEARTRARGGLRFTPGDGRTLTLRQRAATARGADLTPWDNRTATGFRVRNTVDFAARGVRARGAVGETVNVDLGWANKGPGWYRNTRDHLPLAELEFLVPEGARVTKTAEGCSATERDGTYYGPDRQLGAPRYVCATGGSVLESQTYAYPMELTIDRVVPGAVGTLTVGLPGSGKAHPEDGNPGNNTARLVLNAGGADHGSSGSPGGDRAQSTGGTGGALAATGADGARLLGWAAVAAIAVGGALVVGARRRA